MEAAIPPSLRLISADPKAPVLLVTRELDPTRCSLPLKGRGCPRRPWIYSPSSGIHLTGTLQVTRVPAASGSGVFTRHGVFSVCSWIHTSFLPRVEWHPLCHGRHRGFVYLAPLLMDIRVFPTRWQPRIMFLRISGGKFSHSHVVSIRLSLHLEVELLGNGATRCLTV